MIQVYFENALLALRITSDIDRVNDLLQQIFQKTADLFGQIYRRYKFKSLGLHDHEKFIYQRLSNKCDNQKCI